MSLVPRYVQHFSGQGKKYELCGDGETDGYDWAVQGPGREFYFLPKDEYVLCDEVREA